MGRRSSLAALTAACVLLAGCGGGSGEAEKKPAAAPDDVATDIAPPKPTSAQTFAGQSLSENDTKRLVATMTAALRTGDRKQFLSVFDPTRTELVAQQGTWFDNVRKVPMKQRRVVLVKATDTRDSSGTGKLQADMGFVHQITGADAAPLAEWYSFGFKKQGARLLVTGVKGAAADESQRREVLALLPTALGRRRDGGGSGTQVRRARRPPRTRPPSADWCRASTTPSTPRSSASCAAASSSRRTCAPAGGSSCSSRRPSRDVFDYLGGEVKPLEADFLAFASPIYPTNEVTGDVEPGPAGTSRIVLDRSVLARPDLATTIRHEMVHALEHTWQDSYVGAPRWAVEGAAVALSNADSSELGYRRNVGLGYLRDHATLPTDKEFYNGDNDTVSSHYGAGYLACAYLAEKRGEAGLLKVLRALDDEPAAVEEAVGMSEEKLVKEVRAWAS